MRIPSEVAADRPLYTPPCVVRPGPGTYAVLIAWSGVVVAGVIAGVLEGGGLSRLLLPVSVAAPIAAVSIAYRAVPRFRAYVLSLDLRLVLGAQQWRVVGAGILFALAFDQLPAGYAVPAGVGDIATGIAALGVVIALGDGTLTRRRLYAFTALGVGDFIVAFATGLSLGPPALLEWPLAIFPTVMVPFFGILHLVAVLQTRYWGRPASPHGDPSDSNT